MQPEELRDDELANIKEETIWDRKDEDDPQEVTPAKPLHVKGTLGAISQPGNQSTKDKVLEDNSNLEKSVPICQGIEKTLIL